MVYTIFIIFKNSQFCNDSISKYNIFIDGENFKCFRFGFLFNKFFLLSSVSIKSSFGLNQYKNILIKDK